MEKRYKYFVRTWGSWTSDGESAVRISVHFATEQDHERELEAGEYLTDEMPESGEGIILTVN